MLIADHFVVVIFTANGKVLEDCYSEVVIAVDVTVVRVWAWGGLRPDSSRLVGCGLVDPVVFVAGLASVTAPTLRGLMASLLVGEAMVVTVSLLRGRGMRCRTWSCGVADPARTTVRGLNRVVVVGRPSDAVSTAAPTAVSIVLNQAHAASSTGRTAISVR